MILKYSSCVSLLCPYKSIFYAVNQTFVSVSAVSVALLFLFQSLKASAQTHELIVFFVRAAHAWF